MPLYILVIYMGSREHFNIPSFPAKGEEFPDQLSDYYLIQMLQAIEIISND
jgi:hypothetical protein